MTTETIDRLYLELSQITTAKTAREIELEHRIQRLRKALSELIGAETLPELEAMESILRTAPGIEADKIAAINAIHALIAEVNAGTQ